jgi:bacteriorhodopsin
MWYNKDIKILFKRVTDKSGKSRQLGGRKLAMKKILTSFAVLCTIIGSAMIVPSIASVIERMLQKWGVSNGFSLVAGIFLIVIAVVMILARNYIPPKEEESDSEES